MAQGLGENLAINIGVNVTGLPQVQQVQTRMTSLNKTIQKSTSQYNANAVATNKWAKGALQQAGYQVGDFVVQVTNGTSAMQALGQQGSQFAGIFGPLGAVIGAGIAIVSAFAVVAEKAASSAKKASSEIKSARDALEGMSRSVNLDSIRSATSDLVTIQSRYNEALRDGGASSSEAARLIISNSEKEFNARKQVLAIEAELVRMRNQDQIRALEKLRTEQDKLRQDALLLMKTLGPAAGGDPFAEQSDGIVRMNLTMEDFESTLGGTLSRLRENKRLILLMEAELARMGIAGDEVSAALKMVWGNIDTATSSMSSLRGEIDGAANSAMRLRDALASAATAAMTQQEKIAILTAKVAAAQRGGSAAYAEAAATTAIELGKAGASLDQIATAADAAGQQAVKIEQLNEQFRELGKTGGAAMSQIKTSTDNAFGSLDKMFDELNAVNDSIAKTLETQLTNGFMAMVDGTKTAKDAFRDMARAIILELYKVLVVQRLVGSFNSATGQESGIVGGIMKALTGVRAMGGQVTAGKPYLVGERGPEMLVPSRNAHIIPNNKLGGGGVTVVQNNTFGSGVTRAEVQSLLPQMVEAAKTAVADGKRRGGAYGRAFA